MHRQPHTVSGGYMTHELPVQGRGHCRDHGQDINAFLDSRRLGVEQRERPARSAADDEEQQHCAVEVNEHGSQQEQEKEHGQDESLTLESFDENTASPIKSGILREGKKRLFYVLTMHTLAVFAKEKHYHEAHHFLRALPCFELCAFPASAVSHRSSSHRKLGREFCVQTVCGMLRLRAPTNLEATKWVVAINSVGSTPINQRRLKCMLSKQKRWLLHLRVLEARHMDKRFASSSQTLLCHVKVTHDSGSDFTSQPNGGAGWNMSHLRHRTSDSSSSPPFWNEIMSFAAVKSNDHLLFDLSCLIPKTFFEQHVCIGRYRLDLSTVDLKGNNSNIQGGFHRWLSLASTSRSGGQSTADLHVLCYAFPAETSTDLSCMSPSFLKERMHQCISNRLYFMPYSQPQRPHSHPRDGDDGLRNLRDAKFFKRKLSVFVGTWNLGNRAPPCESLGSWLGDYSNGSGSELVVVGSQECSYEPRPQYKSVNDDWIETLKLHLGHRYTLVKQSSLWGIRLCVFALDRIFPLILNAKSRSVATGVAHVMGNKGGVAISLQLRHTTFCFINCHLAAHQHKTVRRNADLAEILSSVNFSSTMSDVSNAFDHCVIMGDLNYRLDFGVQGNAKMPSFSQFQHMLHLIRTGAYKKLFEKDQLSKEMRRHRILEGFKEGEYSFEPSFKVFQDCNLDYDPKRSPAWCDRVLWKSRYSLRTKQIEFGIAKEITTSDHKPLYSVFEMETSLLQPCVDLRWKHIDMFLSEISVFVNSRKDANIKPTIKIKSSSLNNEYKSTIRPPHYASLRPIGIRYTNFARLCQQPLELEVIDNERIGFGVLDFNLLEELERNDGIPMVSYRFTVSLSLGGVGTGLLRGLLKLNWLELALHDL